MRLGRYLGLGSGGHLGGFHEVSDPLLLAGDNGLAGIATAGTLDQEDIGKARVFYSPGDGRQNPGLTLLAIVGNFQLQFEASLAALAAITHPQDGL